MTPVQAAINGRFLRQARRRLEQVDPLVIGITGSFGKTSTKFATARALGDPAEVLATPSSFNTPLGVSRTINEGLRDDHKYFVVEIGARNAGDVAEVARLVSSSIGVLTSIGPAHLESFGSIEGVTRAKYEIVQSLPAAGVAVMNVDDLRVRALADDMASGASPGPEWPEVRTDLRVIRFGLDPAVRDLLLARALEVHRRGTKMMLVDEGSASSADLDTRLLGRHAVSNVLAAAAVSSAAGRSLTDAAASLSGLEPVEHRLQIIEGAGGVTVIDDAYNSNPVGAAAALEVLASMPARKRVVITPGMVELGAEQAAANEELGRLAGAAADVAIFVAPLNRQALVAGASGGRADVKVVDSLAEATAILQGLIGAGDVVLFENDLPDQYEGPQR